MTDIWAAEMLAFLERYKKECREHYVDYVLMGTATLFDVALRLKWTPPGVLQFEPP